MFRLDGFFHRSEHSSKRKNRVVREKRLQLEILEDRELLSVAPGDLSVLKSLYPDLAVQEMSERLNVIELKNETLTAESLCRAVEMAAKTAEDELIVLRTTSEKDVLLWDDSQLLIDFDSSKFGSVTIVGLGTGAVTLDVGELSTIFCIENGNVLLGNLGFLGASTDDGFDDYFEQFVHVSDTALLSTQMVASSIYNPELVKAALGKGGEGDLLQGYGTDFKINDTDGAFLVGSSLRQVSDILGSAGGTGEEYKAPYGRLDAEKGSAYTDSELCWAASAANMLAWTSWGFIDGMTNEDDIFEYFRDHFTDSQGNARNGIDWFLTGHYEPWSASWSQVKKTGGGYYSDVSGVSNYFGQKRSGDYGSNLVSEMESHLKRHSAVGMVMGWYGSSNSRDGGHAVTVWGMTYTTSGGSKNYTGLYITDSDDDKYQGRDAPNELVHYSIRYDGSTNFWDASYLYKGCYVIDSYSSSYKGVIEMFTYLDQMPARASKVDLLMYTPKDNYGWTNPAYVSLSATKNAPVAAKITTSDDVYLHYAIGYSGKGTIPLYFVDFLVDGQRVGGKIYKKTGTSNAYFIDPGINLGKLSAGKHTIEVVLNPESSSTYYAIENNRSNNSFKFEINVTGPAVTNPVLAYKAREGNVKLGWDAVSGASYYQIYRRSGTGDWERIGTTTGVSYVDDTLPAGVNMSYMVRAMLASSRVDTQTITTIVSPAIPVVEIKNREGNVKLGWKSINGATAYRVYRNSGTGWDLLKTLAGTSFVDETGPVGQDVRYMVRAYAGNLYTDSAEVVGQSLWSLASKAREGNVKLGWDAVSGASYYQIHRRLANGSWEKIGTTTGVSYVDSTLPAGVNASYLVRAMLASSKVDTQTITTIVSPAVPVVEVKNREGNVKLGWKSINGATAYRVYRNSGNGWELLKTLAGTSFVDETGPAGQNVRYQVRAYAGNLYTDSAEVVGRSLWSLASKAREGNVKLGWDAVSGANYYQVYRRLGNGSWEKIGTTTGVSYVDSTLPAGVNVSYLVRAMLPSSRVDTQTITTVMSPAAPVVVVKNREGNVKLGWKAINGATSYRIYRNTGTGWELLKTLSGTSGTSYVDPTGPVGQNVRYRVRAYAGSLYTDSAEVVGRSLWSLASKAREGNVKLGWDAVSGANYYQVYRRLANGSWEKIGTTTGVSYVDSTLPAGVNVSYLVRAMLPSSKVDTQTITTIVSPAAPVVVVKNREGNVKLGWKAINGATSYRIYRNTGTGWELLKTLSGTSGTSYVDPTGPVGQNVRYRVRAYAGSLYTDSAEVVGKKLP